MRIVVDTNVIASAVYFGGKPYDLLKLIMEEKVSAIASKEIVDEYEEILPTFAYAGIRRMISSYHVLLMADVYTLSVETMTCFP